MIALKLNSFMTEKEKLQFCFPNKFGEPLRDTLKKTMVGTHKIGLLDCSAAKTTYVAALYHQRCWMA